MPITPNWVHRTHQVPTIKEHLCAQLQVMLNLKKKCIFHTRTHLSQHTSLSSTSQLHFPKKKFAPNWWGWSSALERDVYAFFSLFFSLIQIEWRREMQVFFSIPSSTPSLNWKSTGWFPVLCIRVWWTVMWPSICLQLNRCHHLILHRWRIDSHVTAAFFQLLLVKFLNSSLLAHPTSNSPKF